jgi:uncharacterized protein (TIGR02145 family)
MRFFTRQMRALLLAAVMAVGAVCIWGCGGESNPGGNSENNSGSDGVTRADISGYRTVKIGNQTWMAENLNHKTGNSWCYDNDNSNCRTYGRMYDWSTAMKVCPVGWHLPTSQEWDALVDYAGGEYMAGAKLKSTSGWNWNDDDDVSGNGNDDFGFSALPGGGHSTGGSFDYAGYVGLWWTSTVSDRDYAYYRVMMYISGYVDEEDDMPPDGSNSKSYGISVRCVKD